MILSIIRKKCLNLLAVLTYLKPFECCFISQVKSDINGTVSRQLENLRNREVWLLSQVEIVEQAKEEVLRGQQDRLCHMLGGLQTHLEYSTDDPSTSDAKPAGLERRLSTSLDR